MSRSAPERFHLLTVTAAWDETPHLRGLRLSAPSELLSQYRVPGQYLEVLDPDGESSYFALAAAPGQSSGALELLVRRGAALADQVAAMREGGQLLARGILGSGFPLDAERGRNLVLLGVGSAIAPLRAVVQQLLRRRGDFGAVALYYGQRRHSELAYRMEFAAWERGGVLVVPVLSGEVGYVQDQLRHAPAGLIGENSSAFLCGMSTMVEQAEQTLRALGVPADRIFLNH